MFTERDLLIFIQPDNYFFIWSTYFILTVALEAVCIILKDTRCVSVLLELVFLEEMVLNKCIIIYMIPYSDKYYEDYQWGLLHSRDSLGSVEEYLEEASAIYLDTVVAIITLVPRKRSA